MKAAVTTAELLSLVGHRASPCISLYQPTHRHHPDNQQDPIRFKNLTKRIEESLRQKFPWRDTREMLQPFRDLGEDSAFWNHTWDGLAMFAGPGVLRVWRLQRSLPELAVVAESFHVKPLLRYLQSADRFHVLGLHRDQASIWVGNRYALDAETLPADFPARLEQVVTADRSAPGESIASANTGVGSPKIVHGHGDGKQDVEAEKFFRAVDRAFLDHFSKPTGLPVVLAALPEHQSRFRRLSQNAKLLPDGIAVNPHALSLEELRQRVWQVMQKHYFARLQKLKEDFATAQARQHGSGDLSDVVRAALAGRVGILLLEADRILPGKIEPATGAVRLGQLDAPDTDDVLDDLAEIVLSRGGEVVVAPKDQMPTTTGLAAIFRY
jgi:hypothetical protein